MNREELEKNMMEKFKEQPEMEILENEDIEYYNVEKVDENHIVFHEIDIDITGGFVKYLKNKNINVYRTKSPCFIYKHKTYNVKTYDFTYENDISELFDKSFDKFNDTFNLSENDVVIIYKFVSKMMSLKDFTLRCLVIKDEE